MKQKRKPTYPGEILDELYVKPLDLNLQKVADRLLIARNTLFKIRSGKTSITTAIAIALSEAFDTTPQLWLNLQQTYDLWVEEKEYEHDFIQPIIKNGRFVSIKQNDEMVKRSYA